MANPTPSAVPTPEVPALHSLVRQGWFGLALWMTVGLLLETLLAYKTPAYLDDSVRRELFRLAHTHGTLLSCVLILAGLWLERRSRPPARAVILSLRAGNLLMPFGFLLAGIWHFESDPGLAIWLVPVGAILTIFGAIALGLSARRSAAG